MQDDAALRGATTKFVFFLLFCALSPVASALDVWEFSLWGLNKKSSLIYLTPEGREDEDTFVQDSQGNFIKIKINALRDERSQVVLRDCFWDKAADMLECQGNKGAIRFVGKAIIRVPGAQTIAKPIEARRIQAALEQSDMCHSGEAFFTCQENCPSKLPRSLLLEYCGD